MPHLRDLEFHQVDSLERIAHRPRLCHAKPIKHFTLYQAHVLKGLCSDIFVREHKGPGDHPACKGRGNHIALEGIISLMTHPISSMTHPISPWLEKLRKLYVYVRYNVEKKSRT